MKVNAELIKAITDVVLAEVSSNAAPTRCSGDGVLHVSDRVVSLEQLPKNLDGVHTLVGLPGAIVTPSAKDALAGQNIEFVHGDDAGSTANKEAVNQRRILSLSSAKLQAGNGWQISPVTSREEVIKELGEFNSSGIKIVVADDPVAVSMHLAKWAATFFMPICSTGAMAGIDSCSPDGWVIHPSLCKSNHLDRLSRASSGK